MGEECSRLAAAAGGGFSLPPTAPFLVPPPSPDPEGELAKHAISEGTKAVTKFASATKP